MDPLIAGLVGVGLGGLVTVAVAVYASRWQRRENRAATRHQDAHDSIVEFLHAIQAGEQAANYRNEHAGKRHSDAVDRMEKVWATQNVLEAVTALPHTRNASRAYANAVHDTVFRDWETFDGQAPWDYSRQSREAFHEAARAELRYD